MYVADRTQKRLPFFLYSFITTLLWNACTTWWIWNSTDIGAIAAIIANSLIMTVPWWGYHAFKSRQRKITSYAALIFFWMTFEYIHLNWQLSWPWLTFGNVFAGHPDWVQWYEFTGTSGGTLWILLVNVLCYDAFIATTDKKQRLKKLLVTGSLIVLPIIIATLTKPAAESSSTIAASKNVIIVQPNIDPYDEKFDVGTIAAQVNLLISLSEREIDSNTRLVLWPETALSAAVWQNELAVVSIYKPVFDFVNRHPAITLETGTECFKSYGTNKETLTARLNEDDNTYYDVFNAAVSIKAGAPLQFYNKSKLVPGVETLPDFLLWMGPVFEKFGGTSGGYGRSKTSSVFAQEGNPFITAPIICYESIYGEYVASYVSKGANLLTIITNDGWWGNTPGHKQHLEYARLRAIETRKWVVRSANTGISAVIDKRGEIITTQPWDKPAFIKANVPTETGETFYVEFGDLMSKIAVAFTIILIGLHIYSRFKSRR